MPTRTGDGRPYAALDGNDMPSVADADATHRIYAIFTDLSVNSRRVRSRDGSAIGNSRLNVGLWCLTQEASGDFKSGVQDRNGFTRAFMHIGGGSQPNDPNYRCPAQFAKREPDSAVCLHLRTKSV